MFWRGNDPRHTHISGGSSAGTQKTEYTGTPQGAAEHKYRTNKEQEKNGLYNRITHYIKVE